MDSRARARLNRAETLAELDDEGLEKPTRRIVGKESDYTEIVQCVVYIRVLCE